VARTYRSGGAEVDLDAGGLERLIGKASSSAPRAAADRMLIELDAIVAEARRSWGVKTGRTRRSLRVVKQEVDGSYTLTVQASGDELPNQRRRGAEAGYWESLIARPIRDRSAELGDLALGAYVADLRSVTRG